MCKTTTVVALALIACLGLQPAFAHSPTGIVVDKEGSVYFLKFLIGTADKNRSQLWKLDPDGTLTNIPVTRDGRRLGRPHRLAIDSSGTLYVGLVKVFPDGAVSSVAFSSKGPIPWWNSPLVVDPKGNLYCETIVRRSERSPQLNQLARIDSNGEVHIVAGSTAGHKDGTADKAQFVQIRSLAIGRSGDLYLADGGGKTGSWIRRVTPEGTVSTIAGSRRIGFADGKGNAARFGRGIGGLATDQKGNLYVADPFNLRIRKVTLAGVVTTVAGTGDAGHKDGPALKATFHDPSGIAVGSKGDVYVLDVHKRVTRVRRISPDGNVVTVAVVRSVLRRP